MEQGTQIKSARYHQQPEINPNSEAVKSSCAQPRMGDAGHIEKEKEVTALPEECGSAESLLIPSPEKPPPQRVEETTASQIISPLLAQLLLSPQHAGSHPHYLTLPSAPCNHSHPSEPLQPPARLHPKLQQPELISQNSRLLRLGLTLLHTQLWFTPPCATLTIKFILSSCQRVTFNATCTLVMEKMAVNPPSLANVTPPICRGWFEHAKSFSTTSCFIDNLYF